MFEQQDNNHSVAKQFVKELVEKGAVESYFMVKDKALLTGKTGRSYISMQLFDKSGVVDARIWEGAEEFDKVFNNGDIIFVEGHVQVFQNRKQVIIRRLDRPQDQNQFQVSDFVTSSQFSPEKMYEELVTITKTIENSYIRDLVLKVIEDPEIHPLLLKSPAAKTIHHAWIGGLLEHVLSICKTMDFLAAHYPNLNRDFLIFGAIFHDIGKVWELTCEGSSIQYTDKGRLVGHMAIACEFIDDKVREIEGFPDEIKDKCKHIVLSHHGKLEYGSPKRPKFIEAYVVALVDEMDSKINTISKLVEDERASGEKWSRYSTLFERYFLVEEHSHTKD